MCDHGGGGGGIVHSTAQVFCLFAKKFLQLKSAPRLLRVSQVVGGSLPQLSTKTLWILFRPCNVALWKGGMFFLERWDVEEKKTQLTFHLRVKQLLKEDVGAGRRADDAGVTPLHWAAINDRPEVVDLLLDSGADPNSKGGNKSISGDIVLKPAILRHHYLPGGKLGGTPLHWAATRGATRVAVGCKNSPSSSVASTVHLHLIP